MVSLVRHIVVCLAKGESLWVVSFSPVNTKYICMQQMSRIEKRIATNMTKDALKMTTAKDMVWNENGKRLLWKESEVT